MKRNAGMASTATVTYPPSMIASGMALAVSGVRAEMVGDMYHFPSRVVLAAELVTEENAEQFYFEDAAY